MPILAGNAHGNIRRCIFSLPSTSTNIKPQAIRIAGGCLRLFFRLSKANFRIQQIVCEQYTCSVQFIAPNQTTPASVFLLGKLQGANSANHQPP
jgi:hypothetical protein